MMMMMMAGQNSTPSPLLTVSIIATLMSGGRKWKSSFGGATWSRDGEIGGSHSGAVENSGLLE